MTTAGETCARCGRTATLFPRAGAGSVCSDCYETLGRRHPERSRTETLALAALAAGLACLSAVVIILLLNA